MADTWKTVSSMMTAPAFVATAIGVFVVGFFIGQGSSIGVFSSNTSKQKKSVKKSWPNNYDVDVQAGDSSDEEFIKSIQSNDADDESDSEEGDGKELKSFAERNEEIKLILAVRTDLGMGKGKIAAQCGHATLACYKYMLNSPAGLDILKKWESYGQAKVAVQVRSEEELVTLQGLAVSLGLCARVIHDAGRTQIAAGSATVLGVLGPKSVVDQVTGHLKLL